MNRKYIYQFIVFGLVCGVQINSFGQLDEYERGQQLKYLDLGIRQF